MPLIWSCIKGLSKKTEINKVFGWDSRICICITFLLAMTQTFDSI